MAPGWYPDESLVKMDVSSPNIGNNIYSFEWFWPIPKSFPVDLYGSTRLAVTSDDPEALQQEKLDGVQFVPNHEERTHRGSGRT